MINRPIWMETDNTYPYRSLTMEEYMALHVPQGTCILYLWRNRHTAVVGKDQNRWKEHKVNFLEQGDGYLVRRFSGGGATLRDLGNLNLTLVVGVEGYDVSRQLDVILETVRSLGVHAEKVRRSDVTAEGRRFSGSAFYRTGDGCYYYDTMLIRVDKENISRHLNISKEKLASKSMTSVKSRVANLRESKPDITSEEVKAALVEISFRVYGQLIVRMKEEGLPQPEISVLAEKFAS